MKKAENFVQVSNQKLIAEFTKYDSLIQRTLALIKLEAV
jgi:hypothetical protein